MNIRGLPLDNVMEAYLRRNVAYYQPIFLRMERDGNLFHANWVALFFTPVWLIYRRFYFALLLYTVPVAAILTKSLFFLLSFGGPIPALVLLGPLSASVSFCSFGNYLLYRRFRRLVTDANVPTDQLISAVRNRGGGSILMLILGVAASLLFLVGYPLVIIGYSGG